MKNKKEIKRRIKYRRYLISSKRKEKSRKKNTFIYKAFNSKVKRYKNQRSRLRSGISNVLRHVINCNETDLLRIKLSHNQVKEKLTLKVPKILSLIESCKQTFQFIKEVTNSILSDQYHVIKLDYSKSKKVELGAQIFLDSLLMDIFKKIVNDEFKGIHTNFSHIETNPTEMSKDVYKLLSSVGSLKLFSSDETNHSDVTKSELIIHNRVNNLKNSEQKELHTTKLVDYLLESLGKLNKKLTQQKIEDFSTVIGEILINAEEHSTTGRRYSIGYFIKNETDDNTYGMFHLVILNYGETIYEKFKSSNCILDIKEKMANLSHDYTKKGFFSAGEFEEETLWTLYSLQEGVTSVPKTEYSTRGNGSIRFIESFFNIKGENEPADIQSRMAIISGRTHITFDGKYKISNKVNNDEEFKIMTFNSENTLELPPDKKYVKRVENYFPGTIISAKIFINNDDIL